MIRSMTTYLVGGVIGFVIMLAVQSGWQHETLLDWLQVNLGLSVWAFGACFLMYLLSLFLLQSRINREGEYRDVLHLDQLSDVLVHLFIGIGVIWTAIGMRNALVETLGVPDALVNDAGHVLERLVDGGILLALSTTIIGAIGGYLMRLGKVIYLGSALTDYYHQVESRDRVVALDRLARIESLLSQLSPRVGFPGSPESVHETPAR